MMHKICIYVESNEKPLKDAFKNDTKIINKNICRKF